MKIELQNIGKIRAASIVLDGITVIAGENDTGKSTISKALYCAYKSSYNVENQIREQRLNSIRSSLSSIFGNGLSVSQISYNPSVIANSLVDNKTRYIDNPEFLTSAIQDSLKNAKGVNLDEIKQADIDKAAERILEILQMDDMRILTTLSRRFFAVEFAFQVVNLFTDSSGTVAITSGETTSKFSFNKKQELSVHRPISMQSRILYMDDPFIIDNLSLTGGLETILPNHRSDLLVLLREKYTSNDAIIEILANERLKRVYQQIDSVLPGDLIYDENMSFSYRFPGTDKKLDVQNLSAGLKTFAILKTLLKNGSLETGSTVVLDEPEIHLHPKWQLIFAEIIVLLHKEFNLKILLTTHSPYFFEAIEAFSEKHNVSKECKYYLAHTIDGFSEVEDVTGKAEPVYKLLAEPFQTLTDVEDSDD